jgi:hypothetical protein
MRLFFLRNLLQIDQLYLRLPLRQRLLQLVLLMLLLLESFVTSHPYCAWIG